MKNSRKNSLSFHFHSFLLLIFPFSACCCVQFSNKDAALNQRHTEKYLLIHSTRQRTTIFLFSTVAFYSLMMSNVRGTKAKHKWVNEIVNLFFLWRRFCWCLERYLCLPHNTFRTVLRWEVDSVVSVVAVGFVVTAENSNSNLTLCCALLMNYTLLSVFWWVQLVSSGAAWIISRISDSELNSNRLCVAHGRVFRSRSIFCWFMNSFSVSFLFRNIFPLTCTDTMKRTRTGQMWYEEKSEADTKKKFVMLWIIYSFSDVDDV